MGDKYCIIAGGVSRPETVEKGQLEKGSGQTITAGEVIKVINRRCDVGVPNYTECWGVRLTKDGKVPDSPLDVKDPRYGGQIKEMKWNTSGGYLIQCRYLKGYNSLDKHYQDTVLNAAASLNFDDESSADAFYIRLQSGDNFFDVENDKYLSQMLRIHYLNRDSVSKDPNSQNFLFWEKEEGMVETMQSKSIDAKFEALKIINEASTDNSLSKLKNLYEVFDGYLEENIKPEDLFRHFKIYADGQPEQFLVRVEQYKRQVSDMFEKAKSYDVLDLTKDGFIAAGQNKKEVIGHDIPGKKEGMLEWVLANFTDPKGAEVIFKLKSITEKLK